ncbi:hypothetical protein TIFTF001_015548 [Ficus carica]|uniref:Retrotransposon gag domain-containing protein n=1 Tax=Ficus carica TaxID=3494 RepID=A0AA88AHY7_FICCA|nr:hypothetical protein TIFTF001_015548 [Ficus carica]
MVQPRTRANPNMQEPDLANVVATLQQQLLEQQQEMNRLREQIAQLNQMPLANVVSPQENPVPPIVPQVPEDARHWWMTVQMHRNVTTMSWQDFITEFRMMYYNREILAAQQDEFNSFRQVSMTVMEAVKKFEQLARLCPELVPNETEKNSEFYSKGQSSNTGQNTRQLGRNKRKGNATSQGQQKSYPQKKVNRGSGVKIEGPSLVQGRLEAPEPQARIYAYTKGDVEAGTSSVVTGVYPEIRKKS